MHRFNCSVSCCMALALSALAMTVFATEALPQANPKRIAEITAMLADEPGFPSVRISNRALWNRLASLDEAKPIIASAERVLAQPIPYVDDRLYESIYQWEHPSRDRRSNMLRLAYAECLENKGRFLPRIVEYLEAISSQTTWVNPYHDRKGKFGNIHGAYRSIDLNCGQATIAVALVLDQLKGRLPDNTVARAMEALQRLAFDVYLGVCDHPGEYDKRHCGWFFRDNNWNAACHSYILDAALRVVSDKNVRARFIEGAERGYPHYFNSFDDDGFCTEGPSYWNYGFGQFLRLGLTVRLATGGKVDFFLHPKARLAMEYGLGFQMAKGVSAKIGDAGQSPSPETFRIGQIVWPEMRSTYSSGVSPLRVALEVCTLIAAHHDAFADRSSDPEPKFPIRTFFAKAQSLVCRPKRQSTESISAFIKGGHNGVSHNHNDVGVYEIVMGETPMVQDPGNQAYDLDTFGPKRYESVFRNSYGHNVPFPGGVLQKTGAMYGAKVVSTEFSDERDRIILDLAGAYADKKITTLLRRLTYDRKDQVVEIEDHVAFSEPMPFESPVTTYGDISAGANENEFVVTSSEKSGPKQMRLKVDVSGVKWHVKKERFPNKGRGVLVRFAIVPDEPIAEALVTFRFSSMATNP